MKGVVTTFKIAAAVMLLAAGSYSRAQERASNSSAAPSTTIGSIEPDYRVGAGDSIAISVWKEPEVSGVVSVRPDGKISLALLNDLYVDGMTPMEIQKLVTEKLTPYITNPNVTVTVKEIRSRRVYVLGEVGRPGSYQVLQPTTILQMLTEAGGLKPYAKAKSIYLLRTENGRQKKYPFNYKVALKGEKMEQNILVQPGDTIVVP